MFVFLYVCMARFIAAAALALLRSHINSQAYSFKHLLFSPFPTGVQKADIMELTTEAKLLRFERIHSRHKSSDQWRIRTKLDMDVHSLPSTPLLLDTNSPRAINRCRDEVIDRLSDIMRERSGSFGSKRDWTAWYDTLTG